MTKHFTEQIYKEIKTDGTQEIWFCTCKPQHPKPRIIYMNVKSSEIIVQCPKHFKISLQVTPNKFLSGEYKILAIIE